MLQCGEVIGWRSWWLRKDGNIISMYPPVVWNNGEMWGDPSNSSCEGVHAWRDHQQARDWARSYCPGGQHWCFMRHSHILIGTADLWGHIVEHELGYRAERAKIKHLVEMLDARTGLFVPMPELKGSACYP